MQQDDLDNQSAVPNPTRAQALAQARRSPGFAGICRECGCTENNACVVHTRVHGEMCTCARTCGWANREQTVCDNPECIAKAGLEAMKTVRPWWMRRSTSLGPASR